MVTPESSFAIFFDGAEPPWTLTSHGRATVISNERLAGLNAEYLPIAVTRAPVQY